MRDLNTRRARRFARSAARGVGARLVIILLISVIGGVWLVRTGPVPVVRITTPLLETAPFWYRELAFVVLGMLVADLLEELRAGPARAPAWMLAFQMGILIVVSNLRLGVRLPISGRAAFGMNSMSRGIG
jgi:hypothetical protein